MDLGGSLLNILDVLIVGREEQPGTVGQESYVAFLSKETFGDKHDEYLLLESIAPLDLALFYQMTL